MMKVRQDAWSHEEDLLLAETVLQYIRDGKTQLAAFNEVGDKLNRTSAACGFRWNAEIRKKYVEAVAQAKKERKERKRALEKDKKNRAPSGYAPSLLAPISPNEQTGRNVSIESFSASAGDITLNDVICFLSQLQSDTADMELVKLQNKKLKEENEQLANRHKELNASLSELQKKQITIQEDYQTMLQIMNRAREIAFFEGTEQPFLPFSEIGELTDSQQMLNG